MALHSWTLKTLEMVKVADSISRRLRDSVDDQKTMLTCNNEILEKVGIKWVITAGKFTFSSAFRLRLDSTQYVDDKRKFQAQFWY